MSRVLSTLPKPNIVLVETCRIGDVGAMSVLLLSTCAFGSCQRGHPPGWAAFGTPSVGMTMPVPDRNGNQSPGSRRMREVDRAVIQLDAQLPRVGATGNQPLGSVLPDRCDLSQPSQHFACGAQHGIAHRVDADSGIVLFGNCIDAAARGGESEGAADIAGQSGPCADDALDLLADLGELIQGAFVAFGGKGIPFLVTHKLRDRDHPLNDELAGDGDGHESSSGIRHSGSPCR